MSDQQPTSEDTVDIQYHIDALVQCCEAFNQTCDDIRRLLKELRAISDDASHMIDSSRIPT